jgi:hypothetical protein
LKDQIGEVEKHDGPDVQMREMKKLDGPYGGSGEACQIRWGSWRSLKDQIGEVEKYDGPHVQMREMMKLDGPYGGSGEA